MIVSSRWGDTSDPNTEETDFECNRQTAGGPFLFVSQPVQLPLQRAAHQWAKEDGIDIHVRPVMPIAIRDPEMFRDSNPKLPPYILRDAKRSAAFSGYPIAGLTPIRST